jgi:hypothetical protein
MPDKDDERKESEQAEESGQQTAQPESGDTGTGAGTDAQKKEIHEN